MNDTFLLVGDKCMPEMHLSHLMHSHIVLVDHL